MTRRMIFIGTTGSLLLVGAVSLFAVEMPCAVISAGAETELVAGGPQNAGQALIGRSDNGAHFMHAGGIPCFRVRTTCMVGDVNGDGFIDGLDVQAYASVTLTGIGTPRELCAASIDVGAFVALLLSQ